MNNKVTLCGLAIWIALSGYAVADNNVLDKQSLKKKVIGKTGAFTQHPAKEDIARQADFVDWLSKKRRKKYVEKTDRVIVKYADNKPDFTSLRQAVTNAKGKNFKLIKTLKNGR